MSIKAWAGGAQRDIDSVFTYVGGERKSIEQAWAWASGAWHPIFDGTPEPGPLTVGWYDTPRINNTWVDNGLDFEGCEIGPSDPFRWVIVCAVMANNTNPIPDIHINGQLAEMVAAHRNTGGGPSKTAMVARLLVPSGATCDVRMQSTGVSGSGAGGGLCVLTATGGEQEVFSIYQGQGTANLPRPDPAAPSLTFYVHHRNGNSSTVISGMTEQVANVSGAGGGQMSVGYLISDETGTYTRSTNTDAAAAGAVMI